MAPPKKDRSLYGSLYLYKNPYIKGGPGQEAKQRCSVLYGVIDKHTHIDTQACYSLFGPCKRTHRTATAGRHISRTKTVREL